MERRKFVVGLGSLAAGGAAAMSTGAFTSVQADRDIEVNVAGDADAFLQLDPSDGPNGAYAEQDGNTLVINFDDDADTESGSGLNDDSSFIIRDVFDITNHGTQDVFVWIEGLQDTPIGVFSDDTAGQDVGDTGMSPANPGAEPELPPVNKPADHRVDVGNTQGAVGFSVDTSETLDSTYTMTIVAKAVSEFEDGDTISENPE